MTGRIVIVTGASSGLGYEVARYLCEGGNDVILACRNEEKANRAIEKIKRTNPNALATFMQLDLASVESIKKFVDDFHATEKSLHVLINNAGVATGFKDTKRQFTQENFELTMGTNHLGHFLLTTLLLDDLKKTGGEENGDSRIVTVSSSVHDPEANRRKRMFRDLQPLDFENVFLFNKGTHNGLQAYKNSKAANLLFTYELAKKLEGSNVTANAVCPGFIPGTDLMRTASGAQKFFSRYVLHGMLRFTKMTRSIQQGAQAIITLATDEKYKGVSGKYIKDGSEVKSSVETLDEEKQAKLWEVSGGYLKLEGYEALEVTVPPPEEEEKPKKEKKEEKKDGEAKDGEAKPAEEGEGEEKTEEEKTEGGEEKEGKEEETKDTKEADDDLKKENTEEKSDEKPAEEKPEETSEKPAEEEEKPAEEKKE